MKQHTQVIRLAGALQRGRWEREQVVLGPTLWHGQGWKVWRGLGRTSSSPFSDASWDPFTFLHTLMGPPLCCHPGPTTLAHSTLGAVKTYPGSEARQL